METISTWMVLTQKNPNKVGSGPSLGLTFSEQIITSSGIFPLIKKLICPFLNSNEPSNTQILGTGDCYGQINLHNTLEVW